MHRIRTETFFTWPTLFVFIYAQIFAVSHANMLEYTFMLYVPCRGSFSLGNLFDMQFRCGF